MGNVGIVGLGYLGKFHLEQWLNIIEKDLIYIYDIDEKKTDEYSFLYNVKKCNSYQELLKTCSIIDIVVPTTIHFDYLNLAIDQNKNIFVEKPICSNIEEALILERKTELYPKIIQVGHIERFNKAYKDIYKNLVNPKFFEIHRLSTFNPRGNDVSVIMDLMIHDIDIVLSLVDSPIKDIKANGVCVINSNFDLVNARVEFLNGCVANFTASRISMKELRKMRIFGQDYYASIDFQNKKSEIINIIDSNLSTNGIKFVDKNGVEKVMNIILSENSKENALLEELKNFYNVVLGNKKPIVTIEDGIKALKLAVKIQDSL